jgi:hypothetical protein
MNEIVDDMQSMLYFYDSKYQALPISLELATSSLFAADGHMWEKYLFIISHYFLPIFIETVVIYLCLNAILIIRGVFIVLCSKIIISSIIYFLFYTCVKWLSSKANLPPYTWDIIKALIPLFNIYMR